MENLHFVNGKCDEILANDIVKQLVTKIKFGFERNNQKLFGSLEGWERGKWNAKCWYKTLTVTIGNDDFIVIALRSYDSIVGFIFQDYMYEVGYYSVTTSKQFKKYFEPQLSNYFKEKIIYGVNPVSWKKYKSTF